MDDLSFCAGCGSWVPPTIGSIQLGEGGKVVIVCDSCNKLFQASPQSPNAGQRESQIPLKAQSAITSIPGKFTVI